jgi:HD-like signal output (HDOD) protein
MSEDSIPNNANDWAQLLVKKQLPSPFRVGQLVLRQLDEGTLSYAKLADTINNDPILAYTVMSMANKARIKESESSKTVSQAISMIGVEQLEKSIKNLPFQSASSKDIKSFYYIRCMSTSLYAAHLGQALSRIKNKGNPKDIYWSSLFLGVPLWYLWRYATPEMRLIRYAIRSNFKLPEVAEKEVLGDSIANITGAIIKKLSLPELVNDCYKSKNQLSKKQWIQLSQAAPIKDMPKRIEDPSLLMTMQAPYFPVMLANLVAHFATYDWYSKATLRSQKILATYLNVPLDDAIKLTHEVAADMSRAHPLPTVMLPAAKLMVPPRKRTKAKKATLPPERSALKATTKDEALKTIGEQAALTKEQSAELAKNAQTPESEKAPLTKSAPKKPETKTKQPENNHLYDELTEIMIHRPEEFVDLHELMNAATQGIAYGINLKRATVSLISKDGSKLKGYYSVGCQKSDALKEFGTQIVKNTIFEKLSNRPASIWVKASSNKKITDLLPINFKHAIDEKDFFLMSVFVAKKPVAIFYADNHDSGSLTEHHYKQFKYLCGAVSNALQHQAKK